MQDLSFAPTAAKEEEANPFESDEDEVCCCRSAAFSLLSLGRRPRRCTSFVFGGLCPVAVTRTIRKESRKQELHARRVAVQDEDDDEQPAAPTRAPTTASAPAPAAAAAAAVGGGGGDDFNDFPAFAPAPAAAKPAAKPAAVVAPASTKPAAAAAAPFADSEEEEDEDSEQAASPMPPPAAARPGAGGGGGFAFDSHGAWHVCCVAGCRRVGWVVGGGGV